MSGELDLGSLQDQVAQRAKSRAEKRKTILTIPVPGFEDLFAVQYRRLTFEEKADLMERHDVLDGDSSERVASAADMLINACQDVVQVTGYETGPDGTSGKPTYQSLGTRLTSKFVGDLFALEPVPDTARGALLAALDSDDLIEHFGAYMRQANSLDEKDVKALPGESKPSAEGN